MSVQDLEETLDDLQEQLDATDPKDAARINYLRDAIQATEDAIEQLEDEEEENDRT